MATAPLLQPSHRFRRPKFSNRHEPHASTLRDLRDSLKRMHKWLVRRTAKGVAAAWLGMRQSRYSVSRRAARPGSVALCEPARHRAEIGSRWRR
jgi:hypothetical protein